MNVQSPVRQQTPESRIGLIAAMVVTIVGALVTLLLVQPAVDRQLYATVIAALSLALVLLVLYGLFGMKIQQRCAIKTQIERERHIVTAIFPSFKDFVYEFLGALDSSSGSYLANFIQDLKRRGGMNGLPALDPSYISEALHLIEERIKIFNGEYGEFIRLLHEFERLIRLYDAECVEEPLKRIKKDFHDKLSDSDRESYRNRRRKYDALTDRYRAFDQKVDTMINRRLPRLFFSDLPEL